MIYSSISNDPDNYNTVEFDIKMPFYSERVKWCCTSINTFANFLITTKDDFIRINNKDYHFKDKTSYDIDTLVNDLNEVLTGCITNVSMTSNGFIKFHGEGDFTIQSFTPRVQMLIGLYGNIPEKIQDYTCSTIPQTTFYNILYLRSIQGEALGTKKDKDDYITPICYRINTFLKSGLPIIINKKQNAIETNYDAVSKIKLELVDKNFNPVILKSPMKIDIEIKPIYTHTSFKHKQ